MLNINNCLNKQKVVPFENVCRVALNVKSKSKHVQAQFTFITTVCFLFLIKL